MKAKIIVHILALWLLVFAAACQRIHDPWVRSPNQLEEERFRSYQAAMELRHRFVRVQFDR